MLQRVEEHLVEFLIFSVLLLIYSCVLDHVLVSVPKIRFRWPSILVSNLFFSRVNLIEHLICSILAGLPPRH